MKTSPESRRSFLTKLALSSGAGLIGACAPEEQPPPDPAASPPAAPPEEPVLPEGLDPQHFHIHSLRPLSLETRRSSLTTASTTPASLLFVRNNLPMPPSSVLEDRDAWRLEVRGAARDATLSLAELKQLGRETVTSVLQCSGNGRAYFEHQPSGSPWSVGAAGCVQWTGVRVADLAAHLGGPLESARFVTATGGDPLPPEVEPESVMVERSIPLEKGLEDAILAWELNGQPLPLTHGGPLRLVVPGYFGCNQIKYVRRLGFTAEVSPARIMQKGYRYRPVGEGGDPSQPTMWRMPVKSWVNGPGADGAEVLAGRVQLHGVAFSGERGVSAVEVSVDGGALWHPAELYGPDLGPSAWRTFRLALELAPGTYQVVSRATDSQGDQQPASRDENERGYGYSAWTETALQLRVVAALSGLVPTSSAEEAAVLKPSTTSGAASPLSEAGERGRAVFQSSEPACGSCHQLADAGASGAVGPSLDALAPSPEAVRQAVSRGVGAMPSFGERLSPEQIADLATYVSEVTR